MTPAELKEHVYAILANRIQPRIDQKTIQVDESATIQHAVNIALVNIAVFATNSSREVAIDYLYHLQRKMLKSVTREMVQTNAYECFSHFRTEILAFREMHKLLDEDARCEDILQRVQNILDTDAKEFDVEPGSEPTPSFEELAFGGKAESEEGFMNRMSELKNPKNKNRKA
jgi:hypothetical protein